MQRVSKGFFLGSIGIGLGLGLLLSTVGTICMAAGDAEAGSQISLFSLLPGLYGVIVWFVLDYKMWAAIQDGHARMTPGKAVGFMFIPIFNFYWHFQVQWGFAKDFNAFIDRHEINTPALPAGLFLTLCILTFTTWIPVVGTLLAIVNFIITLVVVSKVCDGVNAIPAGGIATA